MAHFRRQKLTFLRTQTPEREDSSWIIERNFGHRQNVSQNVFYIINQNKFEIILITTDSYIRQNSDS